MSKNLVSQYPISDREMVQLDHVSNLPVSEMPSRMVGQVSSNPESHNFYASPDKRGRVEPLPNDPGFNTSMMPNNGIEHMGNSIGSNPVWMSDQLGREHASMPNNMSGEKTSVAAKRRAEVEPLLTNSTTQQLPLPNKRPAHMGSDANSPGFLQPSAPQRKTLYVQSRLGSPVASGQPSPNKKMMRNDSISGKSGLQRGQTGKRQTAQTESTSRVRPESSEAVRSKMRESLAASLALAFENQDKSSKTEKEDRSIIHQPTDSQASNITNPVRGGQIPVSGSAGVFPSNESTALNKTNDCQVFSAELPTNGSSEDGGQAFQGFQYSFPDEDVTFGDNFFAKDDLLQGNGLSWAFDFDVHMGEGKETQHAEKSKSIKEEAQGHQGERVILTPESVASQIEAELFKLFGDVNKKYREKGRSLIFNLKDRNNPELRERVMSGEISPERLCSMSAEELASKELSEWRMAKAEELAQMKVLPDTEVDIRRLVRKTHKGEYQVEVERDDGIAAEISGGTSVLTRSQPKKDIDSHSPSEVSPQGKEKVAGQGSNSEGQDFSGSLIIPTDGTDLMQGMMVDELKDAEFLPPIVSLDEFMESLNKEPPFENLPVDAGRKSPMSHGESPKHVGNSRASNRASDARRDASSTKASVVKKHDVTMEQSGSPEKQKILPSDLSKVDYIWDGILQLNISSSVAVGGLFQSGEKTSTKEWPLSLEIKGRVRLDAFEKFLQELPMSRTRAVMTLRFVLRDKSSDEQRSGLSEAIDSYAADERLGYAEPLPGVELYLCPPSSRMVDMLSKFTPKQTNNSIENGLIGVVVWRRAHMSNAISPNSSSHHKHGSKKQPHPKRVQDSSNLNANTTPTRNLHSPRVLSKPQPQMEEDDDDNDDDDIPPGFGPGAAKDDDDLPEFNFSGGLNPSVSRISPRDLPDVVRRTKRPVDEVRELIKKYGQSGTNTSSGKPLDNRGLGIEPWNDDDDDDDDIPEWRPQAPQPPCPVVHGHQVPVHLHPTNQRMPPVVTQQPPLAPPGGGRLQPPGHPPGARWRLY